MTPMWDFSSGRDFASAIELIARQYSLHVALGGSVMYQGYSDKDLDLIIYPRGNKNEEDEDLSTNALVLAFTNRLLLLGFLKALIPHPDTKDYEGHQVLTYIDGYDRRVDFFFTERLAVVNKRITRS